MTLVIYKTQTWSQISVFLGQRYSFVLPCLWKLYGTLALTYFWIVQMLCSNWNLMTFRRLQTFWLRRNWGHASCGKNCPPPKIQQPDSRQWHSSAAFEVTCNIQHVHRPCMSAESRPGWARAPRQRHHDGGDRLGCGTRRGSAIQLRSQIHPRTTDGALRVRTAHGQQPDAERAVCRQHREHQGRMQRWQRRPHDDAIPQHVVPHWSCVLGRGLWPHG